MKLQTAYGDEVAVTKKDLISFPNGIPAFEDEKEFVILPMGEKSPFYLLQSVKTTELSFVITEVFSFFKEYDIHINAEVQEVLKIEAAEDVVLFSLLTVGSDLGSTTANLQAPLVVNVKRQLGKQVILSDGRYGRKTPLLAVVKEG